MTKIECHPADSDLVMKDIYFSKIECYQNKNIDVQGEMNLKSEYHIDIKSFRDDNKMKEIIFVVKINEPNDKLVINIVANGIFELNNEEMTQEQKNNIFKYNAVSIMFPFIRSQVSLITAQPGLKPVMLQPINVLKLWQ